jgi:glucose-1-phosphate thymidylyltransferase
MDFRCWRENIDMKIEMDVEDVWTEKQKKGALGSLTFWIEQADINEDLLILASDNYFEFDLSQFIAAHSGRNTLVAVHDIGDRNRAGQFGVVEVEKGRIVKCEEKPKHPKTSLIGIACYIFPPRLFAVLSSFHDQHPELDELGHFITYLVKYDEVDAYIFTEICKDIASIIWESGEVIVSRGYT